ncbi:M14 family metallopeptidase, partial [Planctomycetota bacterium]
MKSKLLLLLIFAGAALMLTVNVEPASAQKKLQDNPGGYHGELDFPISWKRYYNYAETVDILHRMAKQYPHLCDITNIGKSRMGRDMYVLTITAKETGDHSTKAAMWVDGAVHGNEINGVMCSLYVAWYLVTRYDYDQYIHDMLNRSTFYILPGLNVDANDSFAAWPNNPNNPREPYRPEDNDGDGLYDEDQTEDVDGDGQLSTMYIEDPEGTLTLSEDGRSFVQIVNGVTNNGLRFRRIGSEGYDNDGDGRMNEDDIGGPDPNRNYPSGWNLSAGWPYTMSEPCTRNAFNFMLAHPNIFAGYHYHNTGR